jgi:Protein of unknown function (DUF1236)
LTTVAVAAVVGLGGIAAAQSQMGGDTNKSSSGAAQEQKSGEGKSGTQSIVVLPEEIVRIVPEYRGYEYFLVGDEIVIIDPSTLEIVAIIPA